MQNDRLTEFYIFDKLREPIGAYFSHSMHFAFDEISLRCIFEFHSMHFAFDGFCFRWILLSMELSFDACNRYLYLVCFYAKILVNLRNRELGAVFYGVSTLSYNFGKAIVRYNCIACRFLLSEASPKF